MSSIPPSLSLPSMYTRDTQSVRPSWSSSMHRSSKPIHDTLSLPPLLNTSPTNPDQALHQNEPINARNISSSRIKLLSLIHLAAQALNLPETISVLHKESNFNQFANSSNHTSLVKLLDSRSFDSAIVLVNSITRNDQIGLPLVHYIQFLSVMHVFGRQDTGNGGGGMYAAQHLLNQIQDVNLRKYIHKQLTEAPRSSGTDIEVSLLIEKFWDCVRASVLGGVQHVNSDSVLCSAVKVAEQYFMDSVALMKHNLPLDPHVWPSILVQATCNSKKDLTAPSGTKPSTAQLPQQPRLKKRVDSAYQHLKPRQLPKTSNPKFRNSLPPPSANSTNLPLNDTQHSVIQARQYNSASNLLAPHRNSLTQLQSSDEFINVNDLPPALGFQLDSPPPPAQLSHAHHLQLAAESIIGPFPGTVYAMAIAEFQGSMLIALVMTPPKTHQTGRRILIIHNGRTVARLIPASTKATMIYVKFLGSTDTCAPWLLATDTDANVSMWHWPSGKRVVWRKWHRRVAYQVVGFPGRKDIGDRLVLVSCGADHAIRIWGVASVLPLVNKSTLATTGGIAAGPASIHSNAPFVALCFVGSTIESQVLVAAQTYALRVYKARTLTLIHTFQLDYYKLNKIPVCSLHLIPTQYVSEFSTPHSTHASVPISLTETESNSLTLSGDCGPQLLISADSGAHLRLFYLNKNAYSRTYAARELDLPQPGTRTASVSPCGTLVCAPGQINDRPLLLWRTRSARFVLKGFLDRVEDNCSIMGPVAWFTSDTLISSVTDYANGQRSENPSCTTLYVWRVSHPA